MLLLELGIGLLSRVRKSHCKGEGHVVYTSEIVFVMCVPPPTRVGAWSMAVLLGQPFEYYL